jgi:uncharacterized membrane protein
MMNITQIGGSNILLLLVIIIWLLLLFSHRLFRNFNWYRKFACNVMHWHSYPYFDTTTNDGCSQYAKCKWCGYEGMLDSQGNLF